MVYTYKIKKAPRDAEYLYYWYDAALRHGFNPKDISDYEEVYSSSIEYDGSVENVLEELFTIFNIKHPNDYTSSSLSVSDIVELNGINYFVDSFGFKPLLEVEVM